MAVVENGQEKKSARATKKPANKPQVLSKGATVTFMGGGVYRSSTAVNEAINKAVVSTCRVTAVDAEGKHPYHLISRDGKGIYGWVDKENVR